MSSYDTYVNMLTTHKHRLDDELEVHAPMMERINREVVTHNSRMLELKDKLGRLGGRLGEDLKDDDPKATVSLIDGRVKKHPDRLRAWELYQQARAEHEQWTGLADAWKQKGYSIKTLADLYAASYFALQSHQVRDRNLSPDRGYRDMTTRHSTGIREPEVVPSTRNQRQVLL